MIKSETGIKQSKYPNNNEKKLFGTQHFKPTFLLSNYLFFHFLKKIEATAMFWIQNKNGTIGTREIKLQVR